MVGMAGVCDWRGFTGAWRAHGRGQEQAEAVHGQQLPNCVLVEVAMERLAEEEEVKELTGGGKEPENGKVKEETEAETGNKSDGTDQKNAEAVRLLYYFVFKS